MKQEGNSILKVYFPHCRYLKSSKVNFPKIEAKLGIERSCYIEDTGHFNAVEAIIAFNQLAYTFFAHSFDKGLIKEVGRVSMNDFISDHQLPDSYILNVRNLRFRKPINSREFYGSLVLNRTSRKRNLVCFSTAVNFWDSDEGKADGNVLLAFLKR